MRSPMTSCFHTYDRAPPGQAARDGISAKKAKYFGPNGTNLIENYVLTFPAFEHFGNRTASSHYIIKSLAKKIATKRNVQFSSISRIWKARISLTIWKANLKLMEAASAKAMNFNINNFGIRNLDQGVVPVLYTWY